MKNKFNLLNIISFAVGALGLGIMTGIIVGKATSGKRKSRGGDYHIEATVNQIVPKNDK